MSVCIYGMVMPTKQILAVINPNGLVEVLDGNTLIAEFEAIPVPPHGRLIDADALEQEAQKRLLKCNKYEDQFQKPYEVMRAIALAPTIIPAEEGET